MLKDENYRAQTPRNPALTKILQNFRQTSTRLYYERYPVVHLNRNDRNSHAVFSQNNYKTRMLSSRMRTVGCSNRHWGWWGVVVYPGGGVYPRGESARAGGLPQGGCQTLPPLLTE